jgi:hypothetical protein
MRIAGSVITLICGIVVIVGVFLAWMDAGWGMTFSGWDLTSLGNLYSSTFWEGYIVLAGGVLMAVFALPSFIVSLAAKGGRAAVVTLGIFAIAGSLVAVGGGIWFIIDAAVNSVFSYVAYGFYIAFAAAIVGFIFAILTAVFSKGKQDW